MIIKGIHKAFTGFLVLGLFIGVSPIRGAEKFKVSEHEKAKYEKAAQDFEKKVEMLKGKVTLESSELAKISKIQENFEKLKSGEIDVARFERERARSWKELTDNLRKRDKNIDSKMNDIGFVTMVSEKPRGEVATTKNVEDFMELAKLEIAKISDPETQKGFLAAAEQLSTKLGDKIVSERSAGKEVDAKVVDAARKKLLGSIQVAIDLGNSLKLGEIGEKDTAKTRGDKALTKAAGDHEKAGTEEHPSSEGVGKDPVVALEEMAKVVMVHGNENTAENFARLKDSGKDALRGAMKVGAFYQEAMIDEVNKLYAKVKGVSKKLSAAEREAFLKELSDKEREDLHQRVKDRTKAKLKELGVLTEEDMSILCPSKVPAPGEKPCVSGVFCGGKGVK